MDGGDRISFGGPRAGSGSPRADRRCAALVAIAAAVAFAAADPAAADTGHASAAQAEEGIAPGEVPPAYEKVLGERVEALENGLYRVRVSSDEALVTHGPDGPRDLAAAGQGTRMEPGDPERSPVCAGDHHQHVLYGHLSGTTNRLTETAAEIRAAVRRMNAVLNAEAMLSGGLNADYKVLCDAAGEIRVDSFASPTTSFGDIVAAAQAAGFADSRADYTIFFDASTAWCGVGSYRDDERLTLDNRNNAGGGYAVAYQGCWDDETPMHENGHNQGAVQYSSPNSTGSGGHCNDELDVMCYSPDGGDRNQLGTVLRCGDAIYFDCGNDDYFDAVPEAGEYLASNWNIGSPLNRFIQFSAPAPPPTASTAPTAEPIGSAETAEDPSCDRLSRCVSRLVFGVATTATAPEAGRWSYFKLRVPRRRKLLRVVVDGPQCAQRPCAPDLDLYLRRKRPPTKRRWDCRPFLGASDERCKLRRPKRGKWYAAVRSARGPSGDEFRIRAVARGKLRRNR